VKFLVVRRHCGTERVQVLPLAEDTAILSSEAKSYGSFMKSTVTYANPHQATDECAPRREGELGILVFKMVSEPAGCQITVRLCMCRSATSSRRTVSGNRSYAPIAWPAGQLHVTENAKFTDV
jgi:hypothetical protein